MKLFAYTLLLIFPIGQVFGQDAITITNAHSGRRLYAQKNKSGESGFGASPKGSQTYDDQRWNFKPTTCEGDHSQGGPCYVIENSYSSRKILARSGMAWENGVGASTGSDKANQKWVLEESDCGVNERCFFIINAKSGRRLYAQANKSWESGVGAAVGTKYDDQKWFIDIDLDGDFEEPCLDFESLDFSAGCEYSSIESVIKAKLGDCSHDVETEVKALARDRDFAQAKFKVSNMCKGVETCLDSWPDIVIENGCTYKNILNKVKKMLPSGCDHNAQTELQYFTSTDSKAEMKDKIDEVCSDGWSVIPESVFTDIDERFDDTFMNQYVKGETFLNRETGSFEDTTLGESIESFRDGAAASSVLANVPALEDCALPSIMCCFGRDRQPNDNNGNCADPLSSQCVNADPADNSNLCFLEDDTVFPGETEGDIHCHGLAWAEDDNDFTAQLRMNNFFYISLYDHMYQRGYVENMIDSPDIPMCGCIEDMQPVSRSDCTEIAASLAFTITFDDDGLLAVPGDALKVDFNTCKGTNFSNGQRQNNDLASYVVELTNTGLISTAVRDEIFETLVGYATPNDNENEAACTAAYESRTGGVYPEGIVITNAHSGRRLYAQANRNGQSGVGAADGDGTTYADQKWHFTSTDCEGNYAGSGPCYEIINAYSGRRLFAQNGKNWENGVGGSNGYVYPDQKWVLEETESGGNPAFFIVNAYSGRRLYAQADRSWESGVGAGVGTKYADQKWFIPIEDNFQKM